MPSHIVRGVQILLSKRVTILRQICRMMSNAGGKITKAEDAVGITNSVLPAATSLVAAYDTVVESTLE